MSPLVPSCPSSRGAVRRLLADDGRLLLGLDLMKDVGVLHAAYDDAAGVTAAFNRNVLRVINRELDADFDPDGFDHVAFFDTEREWIEMRLRARAAHEVSVRALGLRVGFTAGEEIRTEISAKFTPARVEHELELAGLSLEAFWTDDEDQFVSLTTHTDPGAYSFPLLRAGTYTIVVGVDKLAAARKVLSENLEPYAIGAGKGTPAAQPSQAAEARAVSRRYVDEVIPFRA